MADAPRTLLVNPPISSPLHPQLNLPLLKAHLDHHGFPTVIADTNIAFFHDFMGGIEPPSERDFAENPLSLLSYYNTLEQKLWQRSLGWRGLHVGLRNLDMDHDRLSCESVLAATSDQDSNPFIDFYRRFFAEHINGTAITMVGIAITFQDHLIPAFTLAAVLRQLAPQIVAVLGGQMITRCWDSLTQHVGLSALADYLVLWDGEEPLLNLHRHLAGEDDVDLTNVVDLHHGAIAQVRREGAALKGADIPGPIFDGFDLNAYLLPELLIPFQTTRGCYASCAFCAIPYGSNAYRVRKAEHVIDDMMAIQEHVKQRHGRTARYFKLMEDTSSPSLLHDLSEEIERRGLDIRWETFARLEQKFAEPGFCAQLFRGGCRKIHWGLETNDPDILGRMHKKTEISWTDQVLRAAGEAGIHNFCFVLIGFPGETEDQRKALSRYIIANPHIHTITLATFDLTRGSPMARNFDAGNPYGLESQPPADFQVRLPYLVNGQNWKAEIVPAAHHMMVEIMRERPDIGFVTLFPDQVRAMLCDRYGNDWGRIFATRYGEDNIREMLLNTERYARDYAERRDIDPSALPEPLRREHFRTKEDMALLAKAVLARRVYEQRRIDQV
jgi:hypothetical protein